MTEKLLKADNAFHHWKLLNINDCLLYIKNLKENLEINFDKYALVITNEMGKPIVQAEAEVKKCALVCDYYIENSNEFLENKYIKTDAEESFITYKPLGVILGVMPWNFPFWQVFRFAIPTIISGNTVVVKHASNVPKSAKLIEQIFSDTNFPYGIYQDLPISSSQVSKLIENKIVKAVTLTGSENAGKSVASIAAKHIKKSVLELGGSNAFIVLDDADLNYAVTMAINARMQNAGQSCIAAKRF